MSVDLSGWAIIIAFFGVGVASLSFFLNLKKSKMEKLSSESQFIQGIQHELTKSDYEYVKIKTKIDCIAYVFNYLNTLDRLCYFDSKGWLSDDIITFFKNYLESGMQYYNWIQQAKLVPEGKISKDMPYLKPTCLKHNIKETEEVIPKKLCDYSKLS